MPVDTSARALEIVSRQPDRPWAILPSALDQLLTGRRGSRPQPGASMRGRVAGRSPVSRSGTVGRSGVVALLSLYGPLAHRPSVFTEFFGGTSTQRFSRDFKAALADPSVTRVVIDVDSPGGMVTGVPELADEIYAARGRKPIVAIANSLAASAAYWVASQADEVVVSPSAEVGSIGVFTLHLDHSKRLADLGLRPTFIFAGKHKVEGNAYQPLTSDAKAYAQSEIDRYYSMFTKAVARGRGVGVGVVREKFGQGRCVGAEDAKRLGMADRIETLEATVNRVLGNAGRSTSARADWKADIEFRRRRLEALADD
jgi:signal peptide peptidase SppA